MTDTMQQAVTLEDALDNEDQELAEAIISSIQSVVGVPYLVVQLQRYAILRTSAGTITDRSMDIVLDLLTPLTEAARTIEDANYIAPNLSVEVADLLLFCSSDMVWATLKAGSPNWMMIPTPTWDRFLKLAKAAHDRHAE